MLRYLIAWAIPGAQPFALLSTVGSVLTAAVKAVAAFVRAFCKSLSEVLQNPGTWVAIAVAVAFAAAGGIKLGKEWDEHLVRKAEKQLAQVRLELEDRTKERDTAMQENSQWKGRLDEQNRKTSDANLALEKAESEARAALARLKRNERLRDGGGAGSPPAAKAGPQKDAGPCVLGLEKLWGGC
jgi:hypothetical protein